ncbi:SDR family oxidoreductase [Acetobacteraceae bacterium KSS8]|uniref:SDR family oxidoreductase n=1 Tax=Endosaccharibacter trunci TaxID=2812733 RepID=A0ABT1W2N5_9PROT|nr:SDR family oxidoreductase [Acetobacteraceae bacterium KSS8]
MPRPDRANAAMGIRFPGRLRRPSEHDPAPIRVAILTGGSSGIGLGAALRFAAEGWRVGLISRSAENLSAAARLIRARVPGAVVASASADVSDADALASAARTLAATLGPIDCWVNAAGNGVYGRFTDVPDAEYRRVTDVTYHGTVNGTRVALAHMGPRDSGTIVNVCSAVVIHGVPLMSSYSGAKAAVRAFGQSLQLELKLQKSRVRVSTLLPPAVNTPFFDHAVSHMGFPARPVPPVYCTDVAARGVLLCAAGRGERRLTGVVSAYALIARISPALAAYLVGKSEFGSEIPRDDAARQPVPTLFEPRTEAVSPDGAFTRRARGWSSQLILLGLLALLRGRAVRQPRRAAPLPPEPARAAPGRARAGSGARERASSDSSR